MSISGRQKRFTARERKRRWRGRPHRCVCAEEVDGADLLDEVKRFIRRFVVLPTQEAGDLLALWVLHTHASRRPGRPRT